ncbi:hypothetical protein A5692_11975 [Mycobacterium sp. E342]|uniref:SDR family NAD(P)-dependent oxidoreductase n=1 Tax=Mycobacterium sp. E342 TaxID=1834147 RepID=UPI0007FC32C0|nr:SDR family NAD(P)-dependent oxidoreductase [Mycobacterium sp. E342]OBH35321.1 hypothetical protein A5692_11975 [Mycobacterium sp. E342]
MSVNGKRRADTVVWISGATKGVGAGLASTVPYPDARVINMSRGTAGQLENIPLDLSVPDDWERAAESMAKELRQFDGSRVVFVHNAFMEGPYGYAGEVDKGRVREHLIANHAAALWLGNAFLEAVSPGLESTLAMVSSLSAKIPMEGASFYSASKAGIEMWVRTVALERKRRGVGPRVIGLRLGLVESPGVHHIAEVDPRDCPAAGATRDSISRGEPMPAEQAGRQMWGHITEPSEAGPIFEIGTLPATIKNY